MPAWTHWRFWTRRRYRATKHNNNNYMYLHWHFRSPRQETAEDTYRTYDVVDNIEKSVYCDIQSWLDSQSQNLYTGISSHSSSLSSVNSLDCSTQDCPQYLDVSDDESLYCSILRRKSRDIFMII